jgi:hypothetical protein
MLNVTVISALGKLVAYSFTLPALLNVAGNTCAACTIAMVLLAGITSTMLVLKIAAFE